MATWRDHPQRSDVKVWIDAPTVKFQARVSTSTFVYPILSVLFGTVTLGAYTDLEVGMTVLFGSTSGGDDLGRTYVRLPALSNTLYFGLSDQGVNDGEVNLNTGAYITVLEDYRAWAKVPLMNTGGVRKTDGSRDFATYKRLPPVIRMNCGTGVQADVDAVTGKATFSFVASTSYATEPGASLTAFAYTLPSGATVTSGAANTHTVAFTVNQGVYWLKLVVTDSNGTTQTRRVRLIAQNDSNVAGWELQPYDYGDDGQAMQLKLIAPLPRSTYPDGTGAYVWVKEWYNGVAGSLYGPAGSQHMLLTGWIDNEAANTAATVGRGVLSDTTVRLIDVAQRARQLMIVPISTGNDNSADSWDEMPAANIDKLMVRTLHEYSTLLTLCDFSWSTMGSGYAFVRWDSSGTNLWDALRTHAHAMAGVWVLTFDEWGRMAVNPDPILRDTRTATVLQALGEGDWTSIKVSRNRAATYRFLWGKSTVPSALEAKNTTKLQSTDAVAPGLAGGPGTTSRTESGLLARQPELISYIKHLYARLTTPNTQYEIALAHGNNGGISPAAKLWITVTQSSLNAAQRGQTLATARMLPQRVKVSYDGKNGLMSRVVVAEKETVGTAAVPFTQKQARYYSTQPVNPPNLGFGAPLPAPYSPAPPDYGAPTGKLFALHDGSGFALATLDGGVTWFKVGVGTLTGANFDVASDTYNYGRKFIATADGLWLAPDPYGTPSSASLVANDATLTGTAGVWPLQVALSINRKGYILCPFGNSCVAYSLDYGATWTKRNITGAAVETANRVGTLPNLGTGSPNVAISGYNNPSVANQGWVYCTSFVNLGGGDFRVKIWQSKDWGNTWTAVGQTSISTFGGYIVVPYMRSGGAPNKNDSNQEIYLFGNGGQFWKFTAGGSVALQSTAFPTPSYAFSRVNLYGINTFTLDGSVVGAAVGTTTDTHLQVSTDKMATWTDKGAYSLNDIGTVPGVTGWSSDPNIYCLWAGSDVAVTTDGGATYTNISGNLATLVPSVNLIYAGYDLIDVLPPS